MSLEHDVAAARRAVEALEQACGPVTRHFGDTIDARRLRVDVARVRDDLTLLCGAERAPAHGQPYAAVWGDSFDEGIDWSGRTAP